MKTVSVTFMRGRLCCAYFLVIASLSCSALRSAVDTTDGQGTVILVAVDGFRWNYPDENETPNFDYFIETGVRAKILIPAFPTKTFPNFYTIVTGLYPDHHGIVANNMADSTIGDRFSLSNRSAVQDGRWWGGEPIWVTAHNHGLRSAAYYWPGSEAEIKGIRPEIWFHYDGKVPNEERVAKVLSWLDLPKGQRPAFITLYFSMVDEASHRHALDSEEVLNAIKEADKMLGQLKNGLEARGILDVTNVMIVSDHGMAPTSSDRVICLDDYIDLATVDVVDWSPVLAVNPRPGREEEIFGKLQMAHPNWQVYRKADLPKRLRYGTHPRIPEIIAIADEGWSITTRERFERRPESFNGGTHGYDNRLSSMGGIFIAHGPAFKSGFAIEALENIHLYELMCHILGVRAAPNDGDFAAVRNLLK